MRYFANPSTDSIRDAMTAGLIDCITTPAQGNKLPEGVVFCADNGKFGEGWPGHDAWWAWVQRLPRGLCSFVVAPDVPGDHEASLAESEPWLKPIRALGFHVAFAAQNGANVGNVPWAEFDVLFLAGFMECLPCGYVRPGDDRETKRCPLCNRRLIEWKLSGAAQRLTADAIRLGKRVHMGRVSSWRRIRHAEFTGVDSCDGTYLRFGPDKNLPKLLGWLSAIDTQPAHLFEGSA